MDNKYEDLQDTSVMEIHEKKEGTSKIGIKYDRMKEVEVMEIQKLKLEKIKLKAIKRIQITLKEWNR